MKHFKEPKTISIQPKHINIPTNVCDVSKFTFISPDNGRKYGYDSNGTPCLSKPIQNPVNVSYIPPKESPSITYVSPYSSFTPKDDNFVPKEHNFNPQDHDINISNKKEVSSLGVSSGLSQTQQLVVQALEAQLLRAEKQAVEAKASQTTLGGTGAPYYMHGILKYPGMSETLFEQQRIEFADLKSPSMIQEEMLKAQKTKAINESWERQKAVEAEKLDVININTALKLKAIQEFEASDLGKATKQFQQAEEVYALRVEAWKNIHLDRQKAQAAQQVDQASKHLEVCKAIKAQAEKEAFDKLWYERENARIYAENEKMYEKYAKEKLEQEKAEIVKVAERMRLNSQEDQEFLTEKNARIDHTKKKLYEIELNPSKYNTAEVETHSPLIIKTLIQYSRDYDGFNKQIISDTIPIQALQTLSLKKTDSVDSHAVDLVFDLLRDNHLPSLKTLDLSDNPKSIGADQIGKLADSFFSGNNNLETLDISCVYPPTTDLRAPFKASGERLVGDAYTGDYPLGHKLFELYCSVSTCNQPLSITLESAVSYPLDSSTIPTFNALHIPYVLIAHYVDWMGEPASFKTTSIDMVNHTRQILEKMIEIRDEQSIRTGGYEALIKYQGDKVPHVVETFKWGVTKCLAPKTLNKEDFEWVKDSLTDSPHDYHNLARIMQITQTKLDAFVCVNEVMDDRIITHDMINHKAEWQDAFPLGHFDKRYTKGGKEHITKESILNGKTNTQSFDSGCKQCEKSQFNHFLNTQSILQKNDVTTMTKLDLSHSDIDDGNARILAELIKQGNFLNLNSLNVSDNQITATGYGVLMNSLKTLPHDIILTLEKYSTNLGQKVIKPALKHFVKYATEQGVDTTDVATNKGGLGYLMDTLKIIGNIAVGVTKCSNTLIEVLLLDTTAPSMVKGFGLEVYGSTVAKKVDFRVCVALEVYDGIVSTEGVDLAVKAVDLIGDN